MLGTAAPLFSRVHWLLLFQKRFGSEAEIFGRRDQAEVVRAERGGFFQRHVQSAVESFPGQFHCDRRLCKNVIHKSGCFREQVLRLHDALNQSYLQRFVRRNHSTAQ